MKKGLYSYKKDLYTVIGETRTKNSTTRKWEIHVLYLNINNAELCTKEKKEFEKRYEYLPKRGL